MENLGFLAAMGAALAWGSYMVPFKKSKSSNIVQFQAVMTAGIFIFAVVISPIIHYSFGLNFYGLIAGIMWASANAMSLTAVSDLGLSRALPLWVSVVIITSFFWGVILFHEISKNLILGIFSIGLIIAGVVLVVSTGDGKAQNLKKGLTLSIIAGLLFGSQLVPLRLANLSPQNFFFPMSTGIALFGVLFYLYKRQAFKKDAIFSGFLGGFIWNIGNLLSIIAVSIIGLAKGFPLTQSAVLIAVLWGLIYFKEVTSFKNLLKVVLGALVLLFGVIILSLA